MFAVHLSLIHSCLVIHFNEYFQYFPDSINVLFLIIILIKIINDIKINKMCNYPHIGNQIQFNNNTINYQTKEDIYKYIIIISYLFIYLLISNRRCIKSDNIKIYAIGDDKIAKMCTIALDPSFSWFLRCARPKGRPGKENKSESIYLNTDSDIYI